MNAHQLIAFLRQLPDQNAELMMVAEDEACSYRPVMELIPMREGRVVIAAQGDYERIIEAQNNAKDQASGLRLVGDQGGGDGE